jgi:hypothetical protein
MMASADIQLLHHHVRGCNGKPNETKGPTVTKVFGDQLCIEVE